MFDHSRPVTSRLLQAESTLVSASNVYAPGPRAVEDFRPDVAYAWMLVGIGGLGLMATLRHLGVPWLWHLMDDVPLALCRPGGRKRRSSPCSARSTASSRGATWRARCGWSRRSRQAASGSGPA